MIPIQSSSSSVVSTSSSSSSSSSHSSSSSSSLSSLLVASAPINMSSCNQSNRNTSITQHNRNNNKNINSKTRNYFDNLLYSELNNSNAPAAVTIEAANEDINVQNQNQTDQAFAMQTPTSTNCINRMKENYSDLKLKIQALIQANSNTNKDLVALPASSQQKEEDEEYTSNENNNKNDSNKYSNLNKSSMRAPSQLMVRSSDSPLKSIITGVGFESSSSSSSPSPGSHTVYDENFISSLFNIFICYDFKDLSKTESFIRLYNELKQSQMIKNAFLVIAKLGHECFKLEMLELSECLLEFSLNCIDTQSLRLKMATLSTLSACYWRQSKFTESISCMNLELEMASHLNQETNSDESNTPSNIYFSNIYRLYGNLASAYQRLNKLNDCLQNFKMQLAVSMHINENLLTINSFNSIGIVYSKLKDHVKSLEYFEKALQLIDAYEITNSHSNKILLQKLKLKQNNLIGDCLLKLNVYDRARSIFTSQLELSTQLMYEHKSLKLKQQQQPNNSAPVKQLDWPIDDLSQHWFQECQAIHNLALISSKLKNHLESVDFYEKCMSKLQQQQQQTQQLSQHAQQVLELNGRCFIGIINSCLSLKDNLRAALYAHSMLDFVLKEMAKLNAQSELREAANSAATGANSSSSLSDEKKRRLRYLKFLEMSACSKLASCYWKQNRLDDALKLYQREAELAKQTNNTFYLTRAFSHMAQVHFSLKEFEKAIGIYKEILHSIELSLLKQKKQEQSTTVGTSSDEYQINSRDDRLVQMIYFTLSNIGLCMEMLNKTDDAYLMFEEQYEMSKLIRNHKFKANALLNLINLNLNRIKHYQHEAASDSNTAEHEKLNKKLIQMLQELFAIYTELNDLNGQLFTSQSLAYCFHTSGHLRLAIKYYFHNIQLCRTIKDSSDTQQMQLSDEMCKKSVFNLSLCFKMRGELRLALKYQLEYLDLIDRDNHTPSQLNQFKQNSYARFRSLGIVADLIFEIEKNEENCKQCIQLTIERLKIIKDLPNDSTAGESILNEILEPTSFELSRNSKLNSPNCENKENSSKSNSSNRSDLPAQMKYEPRLKLINSCLEAIAKYYNHLQNYQQVLKFKLIQLEIKKELEQEAARSARTLAEFVEINREKCRIWFEIGSLFLFKFEDTIESIGYFELVLQSEHKDLLLESLSLGNMALCMQKSGDYETAIETFKKQLTVLAKRLNTISFSYTQQLIVSKENVDLIKELISIRIDMARSFSQLAKSYELMSLRAKNSIFLETEAATRSDELLAESFTYLNEYYKECEYLYELFGIPLLSQIEMFKKAKQKNHRETYNKQEEDEREEDEDEENINYNIHSLIRELTEYIFIDYDNSLAKLSHFYAVYDENDQHKQLEKTPNENIQKSIQITEKRLSLLDFCSKLIFNSLYWINLNIQINFTLATFYCKSRQTLPKSQQLCDYIIKIFNMNNPADPTPTPTSTSTSTESDSKIKQTISSKSCGPSASFKDNIYLIETINLQCDISLLISADSLVNQTSDYYQSILDKALHSYKLIWLYDDHKSNETITDSAAKALTNYSRLRNQNILKLKYDSICRVSYLYGRKLKMAKECIEILMDSVSRLTLEFQSLQHLTHSEQKKLSQIESNYSLSPKDYFLTQYMEYLFLLHRKIALMHMQRASDSVKHAALSTTQCNHTKHRQDLVLLALKHVNESLTYLNYHKEFQNSSQIIQLREASIYYLFGKCHHYLNSSEMSLEMFASSLDLYETIVSQSGYDNETCLKDKLISVVLSQQINLINKSRESLLAQICYDEDEETSILYVSRIHELYSFIEDILIRLNKLKEALLVTERHRSKQNQLLETAHSTASGITDLLAFDQIESLIKRNCLNALIYFSYIELSGKLNCWFIMPERNVLKFNQISFNLFDDLLYLLFTKIKSAETDDQDFLLQNIYNLIVKPFEKDLFNELCLLNNEQFKSQKQFIKPIIFIVYDEVMFKLPFHLLKLTPAADILAQLNGSNCTNTKYLYELFEVNCGFSVKYLMLNSGIPSAVESLKADQSMKVISNEKDMENLMSSNHFYELLVLLVNSEHNDVSSMNTLVNTLLSKRLCNVILLEFNYTASQDQLTVVKSRNARQELVESETRAKSFLSKLGSKLTVSGPNNSKSSVRPSLILNTLINEQNKSQQQMLNYLLFGNIAVPYFETMKSDAESSRSVDSSNVNWKYQERARLEPILDNEDETDTEIDSAFKELDENMSGDVTFNKIIVQLLKLNLKFETTPAILNIVLNVLTDYLNDKQLSELNVQSDILFKRFAGMHYETSHFTASKLLLKSLGFSFFSDETGIQHVKLPDKSLSVKLTLISRCLNVLKKFSPQLWASFYELATHSTGREFLLLLQSNLSSQPKKEKIILVLNNSTYKQNETFLKEIASLIVTEKENNMRVEVDRNTLNNIILLTVITLNDTTKKDEEKFLQNYIHLFFKNLSKLQDEQDENDSSSYSTVSSILGIQNAKQVNKLDQNESHKQQDYEIKIYRELNEPSISNEEKVAAKNCAHNFKNMIQIEIKNEQQKNNSNTRNMNGTPAPPVNNHKEPMTVYENYLSDLVDNDLTLTKYSSSKPNLNMTSQTSSGYRNMIDDYKRKNLIRLEQKEYLDQITTITTTVKTFTKDDLFMLFETNLNDNLDIYDNELYSPSLDQLNEITEFTGMNNGSNNENCYLSCPKSASPYQSYCTHSHPLIPSINKNVYSCLTNYITDYSII